MFYGFAMMAVGLLNLAVCFLSTRGGFQIGRAHV